MLPIRVTDRALAELVAALGTVEPEQGGAMLGIAGSDVVTSFVHDAPAMVTAVQYRNSAWLLAEIARRECSGPERFKGIVHSHPAGSPVPSRQDRAEYGETLRRNPELGRYLAAIVTLTPLVEPAEHQLVCGPALVSFYCARWSGNEIVLDRLRPVVLPIDQSLARAGFDPLTHPLTLLDLDGTAVLSAHVALPDAGPATLLFPPDFPLIPPVILVGESPRAVGLSWDLGRDPVDRLADALLGLQPQRPPVSTPQLKPAGWAEPAPASRRRLWSGIGWSWPGMTGRRRRPAFDDDALFARTGGLLSSTLRERRVLVVGVGSVGSYIAEALARSGVGAVVLIDPEPVEAPNLGRSTFLAADVGQPKVGVVADRLRAVNPGISATPIPRTVAAFTGAELGELVRGVDLVVAATDDDAAQQRLSQFAYREDRPAVFVGLYAGAAGGEVIITREGLACWSCSTGGIRDALGAEVPRPEVNYGTGRLTAEPGLLTDIHLVSAAATKIGLALLHPPDAPARLARFLDDPLARGESYVLFGTEPDYWFFPHVFADTVGQHAVQSVWLRPERRPDCPVCGPHEYRADPAEHAAAGGSAELARQRAAHQSRISLSGR